MERLQKILSQAGVASRRASEQLMIEGRVTVNGVIVRELGTKADPARDDIRVDARRVTIDDRRRYLLLNKPKGYVSTRADPERRPTVIDLLRGVKEYVYPVGRLDFDSEGLLLLTNDGDLAARLTHPSHGVARVYDVQVLGVPDTHDLDRLARGMTIDGRRTGPAEVRLLTGTGVAAPSGASRLRGGVPPRSGAARPRGGARRSGGSGSQAHATLRVTIREGRNRQVRKMCDAIGHPVTHLRRVAIGPIRDSRLKVGYWRELTEQEVNSLRKAAAQTHGRQPKEPKSGP